MNRRLTEMISFPVCCQLLIILESRIVTWKIKRKKNFTFIIGRFAWSARRSHRVYVMSSTRALERERSIDPHSGATVSIKRKYGEERNKKKKRIRMIEYTATKNVLLRIYNVKRSRSNETNITDPSWFPTLSTVHWFYLALFTSCLCCFFAFYYLRNKILLKDDCLEE